MSIDIIGILPGRGEDEPPLSGYHGNLRPLFGAAFFMAANHASTGPGRGSFPCPQIT